MPLSTLVATAVALFFSSTVHSLQSVSRGGRYLYTADGNRFYIRGIAYQPQGTVVADPNSPFSEPSTFTDPLADSAGCARDVPFLQELNVNAIRVYSVNSSLNHDACMQALSAAGIYTIIDLSLPSNGSIDRTAPAWSTNLLDLYLQTIDVFAKYDNVLAYNVGNEIVVDVNGTAAAPYIKAAAQPGDDFNRLKAQYGNVTGPGTPSQSAAGATVYPSCPAQSTSFLASSTLPPTPNDSVCNCVVNTLSCQFTPTTSDTRDIVGALIDSACQLLGQQGGNCNDIGGSGSTGTYGRVAFCSPAEKLAYVMTQYYEGSNRNAQACSFAGNATVNSNAPGSATNVNAAVSSCLVASAATFTPSSPASPSSVGGGSSGGDGSGGSPSSTGTPKASGAVSFDSASVYRLGIMMIIALGAGSYWILV